MKMKSLVSAALIMFLNTAFAQVNQKADGYAAKKEQKIAASPDDRASREADRMAQKLGLSAEQKEQWRQAVLSKMNSNKPLREQLQGSTTPGERENIRKEMRLNQQVFENKVNGFLTDAQKKQLADERQKRREHHDKKREGHKRDKHK